MHRRLSINPKRKLAYVNRMHDIILWRPYMCYAQHSKKTNKTLRHNNNNDKNNKRGHRDRMHSVWYRGIRPDLSSPLSFQPT